MTGRARVAPLGPGNGLLPTPVLLVLLLLVLIGGIAGCSSLEWERPGSGSPATDPEAVMRKYLAGLAARDESAVAELIPPGYVADKDIADRLSSFGGLRATEATVHIKAQSSLAPDIRTARVAAAGSTGIELRWTETLVRRGGQWYVLLGRAADANPKDPASTERNP